MASTILAGVLIATPAEAAPPGPQMVTPTAGQQLAYPGPLHFQVAPVGGASGYLFGFFQHGEMVWENETNEHHLSGTEYDIPPGSPGHAVIQPGPLQVWVRAWTGGEWTDATITDVNLVGFSCISGPGGACGGSRPG